MPLYIEGGKIGGRILRLQTGRRRPLTTHQVTGCEGLACKGSILLRRVAVRGAYASEGGNIVTHSGRATRDAKLGYFIQGTLTHSRTHSLTHITHITHTFALSLSLSLTRTDTHSVSRVLSILAHRLSHSHPDNKAKAEPSE